MITCKMQFIIEGRDADSIKDQMSKLLRIAPGAVIEPPPEHEKDAERQAAVKPAAEKAPNAQQPLAPQAIDGQPAPNPEPSKEPTMEVARAALNALRAAKGPKAVREILTAHGVDSFTKLDASEYEAVIEEANARAAE